NKTVIILTAIPVYVINKDEIEKNLLTGNELLDKTITDRLNSYDVVPQQLTTLFKNNMDLKILTFINDNGNFYFTIEKNNKNPFTDVDCKQIREIFDFYNLNCADIPLLKENEAHDSIFFEDLGDLMLGFLVNTIDYM